MPQPLPTSTRPKPASGSAEPPVNGSTPLFACGEIGVLFAPSVGVVIPNFVMSVGGVGTMPCSTVVTVVVASVVGVVVELTVGVVVDPATVMLVVVAGIVVEVVVVVVDVVVVDVVVVVLVAGATEVEVAGTVVVVSATAVVDVEQPQLGGGGGGVVVVHPQCVTAAGTGAGWFPVFAPALANPNIATTSASKPTSNTPIPVDRVTSSLTLRSCIFVSVDLIVLASATLGSTQLIRAASNGGYNRAAPWVMDPLPYFSRAKNSRVSA
jgi:hypothetical protein